MAEDDLSDLLFYLPTTTFPFNIPNYTTSSPDQEDEDLFRLCFRHQSCDACLSAPHPCSWCDISQVCVANTRAPYPFQLLAAIGHEDICPLTWRERWEMRAKPFSCRCSAMTLVSVVVAVLASLLGVLLIWLAVRVGVWMGRKWRGRKEGWWKVRVGWARKRQARQERERGEARPLLGEG